MQNISQIIDEVINMGRKGKKQPETEEEKELEKDLKGSIWERPRKSSAGTRRKKARREERGK